ncbi:MAG: hypothetical protein ACJ8EB_04715 [Allosphingosinicella sp.]
MTAKVAVWLYGAAALAACGREETPAYFNAATGLKLCDSAQVRNTPSPADGQAGVGVIYTVTLRMNPACENDFLRQVGELTDRTTLWRDHGISRDGRTHDEWISVESKDDELLVTYSR